VPKAKQSPPSVAVQGLQAVRIFNNGIVAKQKIPNILGIRWK
jgi:hypothetical protein